VKINKGADRTISLSPLNMLSVKLQCQGTQDHLTFLKQVNYSFLAVLLLHAYQFV